MPPLIDLAGKKFGRLTVICRHDLWHGSARWKCLCECGNTSYVVGGQLRSGHSRSCGCLNREISSNHLKKHGQSESNNWESTAAYRSWSSMLQRCDNANNPHYSSYGGRGISVCNDWRDFRNFYRDMGDRPVGTTIDRIDPNGNYEPGNCRWADKKIQQNNLRNNVVINFNGKTQTLSYWADELGISKQCLDSRLRRGWGVERALTKPVQKKTRYEPGADSVESPAHRVWFCDCPGRGD